MLDIDTLLFASVSARGGFLLIFLLASLVGPARAAFTQWSISVICSALGILIAYTDPSYPDFPLVKGTGIYVILGSSVALLWSGTRAFFGRKVDGRRLAVMLVAPGLVYGLIRIMGGDSDLALAMIFSVFAVLTGATAKLLLTRHSHTILRSQLLVGLSIASYSLAFCASLVILFAKLAGYGDGLGAERVSILTALVIDQFSSVLTYVGLLAMSMEDAQARMKEVATTDALTGLANRRGIQERALAVVGAGRRKKRPMALLIADIDHFKSINDRFGHDGGDAILCEFARRLKATFRRQQDVVGRWGGEEFIAVVHDVTLEEALSLARQLCCRIAEVPFEAGQQSVFVTVSIGVSPFLENEGAIEPAVKRADEALYEAKRGGRNRVCWCTAAPA
ncbi:GGDEF domain-containing protein [Rhizobium sp. SSA_523]|uniref:GGDEF domain-containing protein n=1 Tax=Rhizobium sp. SSA_523 TaxID=2952477 RepID=UPI0020905840|nr:GGDEF domain-containing protein [Rhizobium sp. SSA_523]MCO5732133.1 GGDEF domain-containing protein [Rhizobium sp. SSA_523]WKC25624.1 GGDEF domain-containing protein [Rhizobium sp. SSA_523]